jgi:REP element-mobilizing transposase RayT
LRREEAWHGVCFALGPPMHPDLHIYKRFLPHWRLNGAYYFITWTLVRGQPSLNDDERQTVFNVIRHFKGKRFLLGPHVVMNDHVHILACPISGHPLSKIQHSWKSYSTHVLQRRHGRVGRVWQREAYDRIVRDEKEWTRFSSYIMTNPVRRWPNITDYRWADWGDHHWGGRWGGAGE